MKDIVLIGASGLGREFADVILSINEQLSDQESWELCGVYDDSPSEVNLERLKNRSLAYLGPIPTATPPTATYFVVGIGDPGIRRRIAVRLTDLGYRPATLIHPSVTVGSECSIGDGVVMRPGVRVGTNITIGNHVHLNTGVLIGHDAVLEDYVSINPGAILAGETTIGEGSLVGAGAVILQGRRIGEDSTVAASACVTRDVMQASTVKGIPAR